MNRIPKAGWIALAAVILLAAGLFLIGPPPDTGASTSAEAVAASNADTVAVTDPLHDRPFDVSVWSPADEQANGDLVIISHGFSGGRTAHSDLAQALAAKGYTVAAPTHPDLAGLESDDPALDPLTLRPRHLSLTVDAMESSAGGPFGSVSVIGHSLGGYSALRLAGAQPVLDGTLDDHCAANEDQVLCNRRIADRFETVVANADDFTDERISRVVLLAPGYGPLFGHDPLQLDAAVMVVAAKDDLELPGTQVDDLVNRLGAGAVASSVEGGHYVFLRPCTDAEEADFPELCEDPDGVDRSEIHVELDERIATFLQA